MPILANHHRAASTDAVLPFPPLAEARATLNTPHATTIARVEACHVLRDYGTPDDQQWAEHELYLLRHVLAAEVNRAARRAKRSDARTARLQGLLIDGLIVIGVCAGTLAALVAFAPDFGVM